jgi:hypothetical protein
MSVEKTLSQEAVRAIFGEFDTDKSGTIDAAEFKIVAYALGEKLTKEEVAAAIAVLDTDKNGTIDFDEFFNWINAPRSSDGSQAGFQAEVRKAKLAARYYRKLAENGVERIKGRLEAKPPAPGDTSINFDVNIGNPNGALSVEFSQKAGDGAGNHGAVFITLKEDAKEADISAVVSILNDALSMAQQLGAMPPFEMIPGYVSHSIEVVDYRGGRALRFKMANAMDPLAMAAHKLVGLNPAHIKTALRVSLGASLNQIVHGEASLKDLLKVRVQTNVVAPNRVKDVARAALLDKISRRPPPSQELVGILSAAAVAFSSKTVNFTMEFEDVFQALGELTPGAGGDEAAAVAWFHKFLSTPLKGLHKILHAYVAMGYNMAPMAMQGAPPPIADLVNRVHREYPAIQSALKGVGGVELNFGENGYELALTGLDVFALLPSAQEIQEARQAPMSPDQLMTQLSGFLDAEVMELLYDDANPTPLRIPRLVVAAPAAPPAAPPAKHDVEMGGAAKHDVEMGGAAKHDVKHIKTSINYGDGDVGYTGFGGDVQKYLKISNGDWRANPMSWVTYAAACTCDPKPPCCACGAAFYVPCELDEFDKWLVAMIQKEGRVSIDASKIISEDLRKRIQTRPFIMLSDLEAVFEE